MEDKLTRNRAAYLQEPFDYHCYTSGQPRKGEWLQLVISCMHLVIPRRISWPLQGDHPQYGTTKCLPPTHRDAQTDSGGGVPREIRCRACISDDIAVLVNSGQTRKISRQCPRKIHSGYAADSEPYRGDLFTCRNGLGWWRYKHLLRHDNSWKSIARKVIEEGVMSLL